MSFNHLLRRLTYRQTITLLTAGVLAAIVFVAAVAWVRHPGPLNASQTVIIPAGQGRQQISEILKNEGVISSATAFQWLVLLYGQHGKLKAGEYLFPPQANIVQVIMQMARGDVIVHQLTIPEGLTVKQIVVLLNSHNDLIGNIEKLPPEGSLWPETYQYRYGESRTAILARLQRMQQKQIAALQAVAPILPAELPDWQAVINLAALVERETAVAAERPRVAGVYLNRLRIGMPLQADPTVIYGISDGTATMLHGLTHADLQTPNSYNTYLNKGLPPTPIANPGMASIKAVLQPEAHNYLYFVADGHGGHRFSATYSEHQANIREWLRR